MTDNNNDMSWRVINALMKGKTRLLDHLISGYNELIDTLLPKIVNQFNPVVIYNDFNEPQNEYDTQLMMYFSNVLYNTPIVHENNGCTKPMIPSVARKRNMTYSSNLSVTLTIELVKLKGRPVTGVRHVIPNINIGKLPVMLGSRLCSLKTNCALPGETSGECPFDRGGYFVINGSEKMVVTQERQVYNRICCYRGNKTSKYLFSVEIKSVSPDMIIMPKQCTVRLMRKTNVLGNLIYVNCSRFRQDIPLFVLFRALGVETDLDIVEHILHDVTREKERYMLYILQPSLEECNTITTQNMALEYLARYVHITGNPRDLKITPDRKINYVREALANDLLPHIVEYCNDDDGGTSDGGTAAATTPGTAAAAAAGTAAAAAAGTAAAAAASSSSSSSSTIVLRKAAFLGIMTRKLILCHMGKRPVDDRDSLRFRGFDSTGMLLANLIRGHFSKLVKDMRNGLMKEMGSTNWSRTHRLQDLINDMNIHKVVKSNTIESALRYALSTGNFFHSKTPSASASSNKLGVAQVLNRQSHLGQLSHSRRLHAAIDKNNCKLTNPRKCKGMDFGFIDPCETPEGGSIGAVKNLAMCATISGVIDPEYITRVVERHVLIYGDTPDVRRVRGLWMNVFVNNNLIGLTDDPVALCTTLRHYKRTGAFHPYTSIYAQYQDREVHICTAHGRLVRPVLIVEKGRIRMDARMARRLMDQRVTREELIIGFRDEATRDYVPSVIEYIDADESDSALLSMSADYKGTFPPTVDYCEIHPAVMLGAISGTIPFSDHNQSPRNTYQSAMCKQAMGLYIHNHNERFDSLANVLNYPSQPLVYTRIGKLVNQDKLPSGCVAIIAILTSSGFNQEDSIIMNQDAIRRGYGHSTHYRTYRDEEHKNGESGEDERFGRPNPTTTRGMKLGSYDALDERGFAREGCVVRGGDVIIGKTVVTSCDTSDKPELDLSTTMRANEDGVVDRVLEARNGDGYRFSKVRTRSIRGPQIGDKFSSCHGQKGTIGSIIPEADMPYVAEGPYAGIPPDIILNPHAIPTRMTAGQLYEMLFSIDCAHNVQRGDGTAFNREVTIESIAEHLHASGLAPDGETYMINGSTGQRLRCKVFVAPVQMQKLKHMVDDKIHSRGKGPVIMLTRQPSEGRARDGGLRVGEMERDCLIAHGGAAFLKETMLERSDIFDMHVGDSGMVAAVNKEHSIYRTFEDSMRVNKVVVPYACKLLGQELQAMNIGMRTQTNPTD